LHEIDRKLRAGFARLGQLHNLRRSLGVDASKAIEALMVKLNAEPTNEAVLSGLD